MLKKIGHLILFSYMYLTVYYFKSLQERFLGKLFYFAKIKYRISLTRNRYKADFGWKKWNNTRHMKELQMSIILVEILWQNISRFCNMFVFIAPPFLLLRIWLEEITLHMQSFIQKRFTAKLTIIMKKKCNIDFKCIYLFIQRRKFQPTPVFLPGESLGQRSLAGCSAWECK